MLAIHSFLYHQQPAYIDPTYLLRWVKWLNTAYIDGQYLTAQPATSLLPASPNSSPSIRLVGQVGVRFNIFCSFHARSMFHVPSIGYEDKVIAQDHSSSLKSSRNYLLIAAFLPASPEKAQSSSICSCLVLAFSFYTFHLSSSSPLFAFTTLGFSAFWLVEAGITHLLLILDGVRATWRVIWHSWMISRLEGSVRYDCSYLYFLRAGCLLGILALEISLSLGASIYVCDSLFVFSCQYCFICLSRSSMPDKSWVLQLRSVLVLFRYSWQSVSLLGVQLGVGFMAALQKQ